MSHGYVTVQWNRRKVWYDVILWLAIIAYLGVYVVASSLTNSGAEALSDEIILIRALASCAFVLLTLILCIGPLARLNRRFLPLLYNRRHLGVSMFVIALAHAILATLWYHGFGVISPLESLFTWPADINTISDIPFQPLGALALVLLLLLAATSHDYWNTNLGAPLWKALHMLVYVAYAAMLAHVALGALQESNTGFSTAMAAGSLSVVSALHLASAFVASGPTVRHAKKTWVGVGSWREIDDNCGITVDIGGTERIAVFRYDGYKVAAVSNVCRHQNGPLGEGRVIDGCITCPWHGFQYRPEDGRSPPPFTDIISTYDVRIDGEQILINPTPLPPGTARPVAIIEEAANVV
ncbi:MAG: ferric reductase-like transmembrane domain-containing protein [Pseudomonadota bacterium]